MAQAARPLSGQTLDHPPSVASAIATADQPNSSPAGLRSLELVELTTNPLIEGILGPNKDGRIRNAVPSKLKGKTDNKQGNFGVMSMGVSPVPKKNEGPARDFAAERDAAARRTSENTESRAKAAQQQKYAPPKKRGLEATLSEATRSTNRGSPFAKDDRRQSRPLAPDETKQEQARLLTLLRSINPVTVVDQICKAVAYFGGIPGAPPPEDGIFPESANTRETGALFIGWIAEIFPDLAPKSPEVTKTELKKKGRPSKGYKAEPSGGEGDEVPNSRNGYGFGPAVSAPAWGLPTNLAEVNPHAPSVPEGALGASVEQPKQSEQQPTTPLRPPEESANNTMSASKRRRGRPKGSTNKKGKADGQPGDNSANNVEFDGQSHPTGGQLHQSPEAIATTSNVIGQDQPAYHSALDNQLPAPKPAQSLQYADQSWQNDSHKNSMGQASAMPQDELSPEERAVLEAFRSQGPDVVGSVNALPSPVVPTKGPTEATQPPKRKRAPPKPKVTAAAANSANASNMANSTSTTNFPVQIPQQMPQQVSQQVQDSNSLSTMNNEPVMGMSKDAIQWASVDATTATAPPPAKRQRQRKPKVPNANEPPSRKQTASVANSATPPIPPSTIPDSQATPSQQSIQQSLPTTRPPAEGLEAHYERFANLQQQQNGRSHTPTQQQQHQHVRQPSKPSSVTSQQTTPQMPQQMQHQSSQQGTQQNVQRDDPKISQGASSMSSTGYYNQRTQSTPGYNQQYPSHQPSQLYSGHSASPQMSNSSYRTSSTHTMAQPSPQFSQAENTYRTASPHTISQTSPSFTQADNQFRATNTHSLAQPSPSFSQAENTYRTPSTHSMTQPSASFSASRTTQQPTHQSHYSQFSDSSYIDLPTLESLGHSSSSTASLGGYGQQNLGLTNTASHSRSGSTSSLYGTSSNLNNAFDTAESFHKCMHVLRNILRHAMPPKEIYIGVIGAGGVGKCFLSQLESLSKRYATNSSSPKLSLILVSRSTKTLYSENYAALPYDKLATNLDASTQKVLSVTEAIAFLSAAPAKAILVDNTSSQDVADQYPQVLSKRVSIVTPNKKAFSGSYKLWQDIFSAAASSGAKVYHESSVGAGLPVISTLKDLVDTGDEVTRIEGVFSGTMSFLFNSFAPTEGSGGKWSAEVTKAKELGYTEPDPRDDLNGLDVARKLTILARLAGLPVESSTSFPVQSLIPKELESVASGDEFLQKLPQFDSQMEETKVAAEKEGKVVRFVGSIDVAKKAVKVGLEKFDRSHPIAALKGSDNIISFYTKRYGANPLIIQGAGAGGEVTAMGVTADLIKVLERLS